MTEVRVVGLDPTSRGWVFAVVETSLGLVDHGLLRVRSTEAWREHAIAVVGRFDADALAIADPDRSRFRGEALAVLRLVQDLHATKEIPVLTVDVYAHRRRLELSTKRHAAEHLASKYPELAGRLPRKRKPWMSEDWSMNLFDALLVAELALHEMATPTSVTVARRRGGCSG